MRQASGWVQKIGCGRARRAATLAMASSAGAAGVLPLGGAEMQRCTAPQHATWVGSRPAKDQAGEVSCMMPPRAVGQASRMCTQTHHVSLARQALKGGAIQALSHCLCKLIKALLARLGWRWWQPGSCTTGACSVLPLTQRLLPGLPRVLLLCLLLPLLDWLRLAV